MDIDAWEKKIQSTLQEEAKPVPRSNRGRPKKTEAAPSNLGGISPEQILAAKPKEESVFIEYNAELVEYLKTPPVAFVEPEGPKLYPRDTLDSMLPEPGFITDFVNTGRGMESPTLFFVWNALWLLSTVLKREAWLRWYPGKLWPNLYVVIVAPPALCRKSSSMTIGDKLLRSLPSCLPSTLDAYKKETKIITGKTTPEGLLGALAPDTKMFFKREEVDESAKLVTVEKGSQVALSISEFAVFLGKQQYNTGMVTLLTDLFDCKDSDAEVTRGRGEKPLTDIYVTLFGAITPDGLRMSVPEEAFGGGFMSRMIIAYQGVPTKIYSMPKRFTGYPTWEDLRLKLAWIAQNAVGEYYLTPEAEAYYDSWYREWKSHIFESGSDRPEENRIDSLILRVALLMRVQEYRPGQDITVANIHDAKRLIEFTMATSKYATEDVGGTVYSTHMHAVKRLIERRGSVDRRRLSQFMSSRGATAKEISDIIDQLSTEGFLRIKFNDTVLSNCTGAGKEVYELLEEHE